MMNDIKEKIEILILKMKEMSDLFYKQQVQEGYILLQSIIEEIMILTNELLAYKSQNNIEEIDINGISITLKDILAAMEKQDTILMADIVLYEMVEKLQIIHDLL